jgi:hypothetical protein
MPLTLNLDPHGEQLVAAHLRSRYHSPEEVVTRALETLAEKEPPAVSTRTMAYASETSSTRGVSSAYLSHALSTTQNPHMPWTPPPGGVEEEQSQMPGSGVW